MGAVDLEFSMKNDYAHQTSQRQEDIAVTFDRQFKQPKLVDHHLHSDFIIHIKVCAMVTGEC